MALSLMYHIKLMLWRILRMQKQCNSKAIVLASSTLSIIQSSKFECFIWAHSLIQLLEKQKLNFLFSLKINIPQHFFHWNCQWNKLGFCLLPLSIIRYFHSYIAEQKRNFFQVTEVIFNWLILTILIFKGLAHTMPPHSTFVSW